MAVNQKQIAERMGVSIALVSRVLSGKAREIGIADATVARVLEAAEQMGYVPNAAALTLKGKASRTIGVVVYDFQDPFFAGIIEQLQVQAHKHGYSLVLAGFRSRMPEGSDLAPLHKHAIDGLIILGSDEHAAWLDGFSALPVARIGKGATEESSVRISIDETHAAIQLMEHLREKNRTRLVVIGEHLPGHRLRFQAMEVQARAAGIHLRSIISPPGVDFEVGLQSAQSVLQEKIEADVLVCATDTVAMGALHALYDAGSKLAVTGFDDIPAAAQFIPPITTIRQPIGEMVQRAFKAVIDSEESCEILLNGELVVRSSS